MRKCLAPCTPYSVSSSTKAAGVTNDTTKHSQVRSTPCITNPEPLNIHSALRMTGAAPWFHDFNRVGQDRGLLLLCTRSDSNWYVTLPRTRIPTLGTHHLALVFHGKKTAWSTHPWSV